MFAQVLAGVLEQVKGDHDGGDLVEQLFAEGLAADAALELGEGEHGVALPRENFAVDHGSRLLPNSRWANRSPSENWLSQPAPNMSVSERGEVSWPGSST